MLSDEDIKKLTKAQIEAQKEVFFTKDELDVKIFNLQDVFATKKEMSDGFDNINKKLDNLQTSVVAIAISKSSR
jgi:hypothetical protein